MLTPPFHWIHVDAHDDFWGHYSKPSHSGNFLYECIRRGWIASLTMVFSLSEFDFPAYVLRHDPLRVEFETFSVPLSFSDTKSYSQNAPPDFVFLARSPAYTPQSADVIYDHVRTVLFDENSAC